MLEILTSRIYFLRLNRSYKLRKAEITMRSETINSKAKMTARSFIICRTSSTNYHLGISGKRLPVLLESLTASTAQVIDGHFVFRFFQNCFHPLQQTQ
jgi:hypothetical protein